MQDNRLMRMLHMLLHVALHDGTATSQTIAQLLGTNPVVVVDRQLLTRLNRVTESRAAR